MLSQEETKQFNELRKEVPPEKLEAFDQIVRMLKMSAVRDISNFPLSIIKKLLSVGAEGE